MFQGTMLTAFLLTGEDDGTVSVGFSVPKKLVPLAAQRNRIRRLMREAVRKHLHDGLAAPRPGKKGASIVLMFKKEKNRDLQRLSLRDVEPAWCELQQRILKAL